MASVVSQSGRQFLNRKKIIGAQRRRPRWQTDSLQSHLRPVRALPEFLPVDTVATRIKTQTDKDRVPYQDA